jgi:hypothetical protein
MPLFHIFHEGNCHNQCCIIFWRPMSIHNFRALLYMSKYCIPYGYNVRHLLQLPAAFQHTYFVKDYTTYAFWCTLGTTSSVITCSKCNMFLAKTAIAQLGHCSVPLSKLYTIWVLKIEHRKLTVTAKLQFQEPIFSDIGCYHCTILHLPYCS